MTDSLLDQLARQRGIGDAYHNYRGELLSISRQTKTALLSAMGYPTQDAASIEHVLREGDAKRFALLEPVAVVHPGKACVTIAVPADELDRNLHWSVTGEIDEVRRGTVRAGDLAEHERREIAGRWLTRRTLPLPADLAHGLQQLQVSLDSGAKAQCALIAAPRACFEPRILQEGGRLWGVAAQLYTLRSHRNWGMGDFADLEAVVRSSAPFGASFIGLNPLHALFPGNPWHFSPYSASSRHFLNVLYIAVDQVPELAECAAVRALVASTDFQSELERLRATATVDYPGVAQAKLSVLRTLFEHFRREHIARKTPRARQFEAFVAQRGVSLHLHALHDAIDEHLRAQDRDRYWGWPVWPEELRDPSGEGARAFAQAHAEAVTYHSWLQWLADQQLGAVQRLARSLGMAIGLYGDYAVGVNPSGSETWSDQALYRKTAGVGAPPDALALKGQDWGIPPQDPNVLAAELYQPFRELLADNMRHFGALRLDHVMALFRQWWVPVGMEATEGGYVHYPLDDLMSVLALESERHACLVVGEDLGTVPPEMCHAMDQRAVYSYRVLLFEKHGDGRFIEPGAYPRRAIATVTTHDLPTLSGYWLASDIALRQRLALYPSEDVMRQVARERDRDRAALLQALDSVGLKPEGAEASPGSYSESIAHAVHVYLARTAASLAVLQAEDLVGMGDPVNVPGTNDEYANWQRKMSCTIDEMFRQEAVQRALHAVHAARAG